MSSIRSIELLAPAKNLACGLAAVDHGADAVYIGAPQFGARAAATNSLDDIAALVTYAHLYRVKIYVAVNTLLLEEELPAAQQMAWDLYAIGVDALIVQDMAFTQLDLPPIPLHASTQMDNRTPAKVAFLAEAGFDQVVLARELSLPEIAAVHAATPVPLEVFVHGALCVSYSGQCYASQACYGRSANRGNCAQFCRLPFRMEDAEGRVIREEQHLLSLKDMNQSDHLEQLLDAGVTSFKIEGRLKEVNYVKNVTAYYRQQLDALLKRKPDCRRASSGSSTYTFQPQVAKSFNRGFTSYFLKGRSKDIYSFGTPKALGEPVGKVKEVRGNYILVAGVASFSNGDGLCYHDAQGKLQGFRVNRADCNKLYPLEMPDIAPHTPLYRNLDQAFEKLLARPSATRTLSVALTLSEYPTGFTLSAVDEDNCSVTLSFPREKEVARRAPYEQLRAQLSKLGQTPFTATAVDIVFTQDWFIPTSEVNEWRRQLIEALLEERRIRYPRRHHTLPATTHPYVTNKLTYLGNVMNSKATTFYQQHGVEQIAPAFELAPPAHATLLFTKHCLRYAMGICPTHQQRSTLFKEPFYLVGNDGKRFLLTFDCKQCLMKISATE